jgi:hypothetical protein
MENSDFALSARSDRNMMYGVECKDQQSNGLYVRTSAQPVNQPVNFTDFGNFYIACQNTTIGEGTVLGEVWVTYDIEFQIPHMPSSRFGYLHQEYVISATSASLIPLQTNIGSYYAYGSMSSVTWNYTTGNLSSISFPQATLGDIYQINITAFTGSETYSVLPSLTFSGMTGLTVLNADSNAQIVSPIASQTASRYIFQAYYKVTDISQTSTGLPPGFNITPGTLSAASAQTWDVVILNVGSDLAL